MSHALHTRIATPSIETVMRIEHVTARYGNGPAVLDDVSVDLRAGSFTGIVGPSGSGKTTLLRMMLGLVEPIAGDVVRRPALRLGYVPQVETINWNFPVTVSEVVLMSSRNGRRSPWVGAGERRRAADALERLGIADLAKRHIRQLSGGQQQRVFIARAMLSAPDLLLLDEPTSGVDVRTRHEMLHLLGDLNADGLTIVVTTHDLNGLAAHLPRVICLNTSVMGVGTPTEVMTPEILERTFGAPMEVLVHMGMPLVVESPATRRIC